MTPPADESVMITALCVGPTSDLRQAESLCHELACALVLPSEQDGLPPWPTSQCRVPARGLSPRCAADSIPIRINWKSCPEAQALLGKVERIFWADTCHKRPALRLSVSFWHPMADPMAAVGSCVKSHSLLTCDTRVIQRVRAIRQQSVLNQ